MPEGSKIPADVYSLYLIRCADGSFYTGIATDVKRRLVEHQNGRRGSKYLRGRGPLTLHFEQIIGDRRLASRLEWRVKRMPAADKADPNVLREQIEALLRELDAAAVA